MIAQIAIFLIFIILILIICLIILQSININGGKIGGGMKALLKKYGGSTMEDVNSAVQRLIEEYKKKSTELENIVEAKQKLEEELEKFTELEEGRGKEMAKLQEKLLEKDNIIKNINKGQILLKNALREKDAVIKQKDSIMGYNDKENVKTRQEYKNDLNRRDSDIEKLNQSLADLTSKSVMADTSIYDLRADIQLKEKQILELTNKHNAEMQKSTEEKEQELATLKREMDTLQKERDKLVTMRKEIKPIRGTVSFTGSRTPPNVLDTQIKNTEEKIEKLEIEIEEIKSPKPRPTIKLQKVIESSGLSAKIPYIQQKLQEKLQSAQEVIKSLNGELGQLKDTIDRLSIDLKRYQDNEDKDNIIKQQIIQNIDNLLIDKITVIANDISENIYYK